MSENGKHYFCLLMSTSLTDAPLMQISEPPLLIKFTIAFLSLSFIRTGDSPIRPEGLPISRALVTKADLFKST